MLDRILCYIKIFFLNPKIFFKKTLGRILLEFIPSPKGIVQINIAGHIVETFPSRNEWWKTMYLGCCGVEIVHNIKKYLPRSGVFIDVGAGVGYFSTIASGIVGDSGQVHCFEPFPPNAKIIRKIIESNTNSNIILNDYALGVDDNVHRYYIQHYERSNSSTCVSMVDNIIKEVDEVIEVRTKRLDTYLKQKSIDEVSLIKIDVEGYEYFVLRGLSSFLKRATRKPPIICEVFSPAYEKSELSLDEFQVYMRDYGYQAYNIFNSRKRVDIRLLHKITDVVFIAIR